MIVETVPGVRPDTPELSRVLKVLSVVAPWFLCSIYSGCCMEF